MIRTCTLHRIDVNDIASTERWYIHQHGPQVARRYGPWLARFESYRPVEIPDDAKGYGIANYLDTEGWWRELPDLSDEGFLGMTPPYRHARPFSCVIPPQPTEDFKGSQDAPEAHFILRWVQLIEWPESVDKDAADAWYRDVFAPAAVRQSSLNRFFSYKAIHDPNVGLPGHWATVADAPALQGSPADHCWDRFTEMWFDDFIGWRAFIQADLPKPEWAETEGFPFLAPDTHFVSSFLLETPAYDWMSIDRAVI